MNQTEQMNDASNSVLVQPAAVLKMERLPVHFAADFPIEFIIRRLEDVPLRAMTRDTEQFKAVDA